MQIPISKLYEQLRAVDTSIIGQRVQPFKDLGLKIMELWVAALLVKGEEEIIRLARSVSGSARNLRLDYQRSDSLPQFLEVIARSYETPNGPQNYIAASPEIARLVLEAGKTFDITPKEINGLVANLEKYGIQADYLEPAYR